MLQANGQHHCFGLFLIGCVAMVGVSSDGFVCSCSHDQGWVKGSRVPCHFHRVPVLRSRLKLYPWTRPSSWVFLCHALATAGPEQHVPSARQLTALIKNADSWDALEQRIVSGVELNHVHLCAALQQARHLSTSSLKRKQQKCKVSLKYRFLQLLAIQFKHMGSRELAQVMWNLAWLGWAPDTKLLRTFEETATTQIRSFNPQDISMTLWALATLRVKPRESFVTQLLAQWQEVAARGAPQAYSNTLWSLATLQMGPEVEWLEDYCRRQADQLHQYNPQALSNTLWALAKLGYQPSGVWFTR